MPTLTAVINHELTLTKEKLAAEIERSATLTRNAEKFSSTVDAANIAGRTAKDALIAENEELRAKLFVAEKSNIFLLGNPYPIGLDKVKIGDPKSKVAGSYPDRQTEDSGKTVTVTRASDIFRRIKYSSVDRSSANISSIVFDLGTIDRITDRLPGVPNTWIEETLRKVLGEPLVIGSDNDCLLWKVSTNEVVYYQPPSCFRNQRLHQLSSGVRSDEETGATLQVEQEAVMHRRLC